jgi:hypothetical protein
MGLSSARQVRRFIKKLRLSKLIEVKSAKGFSNTYTFNGLIEKLSPYWEAEKNRSPKQVGTKMSLVNKSEVRTKTSGDSGQKCPPKHCNRNSNEKHSNVFYKEFEKLETLTGDMRVDACFKISKETSDEKLSEVAMRLGDILLRLAGHGVSEPELKKSLRWYIKIAREFDQDMIEQVFSKFKEVQNIRNAGGLFTANVKRIQKRPMTKAPSPGQIQERKVA